MNNAFTYQRVAAYLVDIILIGILVTLLTFWIPESEKYKAAMKEKDEISDLYVNKEIDTNEYIDSMYAARYVIEKEIVVKSIITIVVTFAYFATFAYYNNGQTLGKKLLHIKVVNNDGKEVSHLQLALRTLIINEVFFSTVSVIMLFFIKSDQFFYTIGLVELVQSLVVIVALIMVMVRKDKKGLHDMLCQTKVVQV